METHPHEQVHWQAPRASVATTEVLAGWGARRDRRRLHHGEAILINGIVHTQQLQTLYSSTPHWSCAVGHGIFGATLVPRTLRRHSL